LLYPGETRLTLLISLVALALLYDCLGFRATIGGKRASYVHFFAKFAFAVSTNVPFVALVRFYDLSRHS
jgi:hypothetical protein